jgi:hypothetical protein
LAELYDDAKNSRIKWDYDCTTYYLEYGGSVPMAFGETDPFNEIKSDAPPEYYEWMKGGRSIMINIWRTVINLCK